MRLPQLRMLELAFVLPTYALRRARLIPADGGVGVSRSTLLHIGHQSSNITGSLERLSFV